MKRCTKCRRELDGGEFYRDARFKSGLHPWCKQCKNERSKENAALSRRKLRELQKSDPSRRPMLLDLYAEEEYLMERLDFVRRWIARLSCAAALLLCTSCVVPLAAALWSDEPEPQPSFEDRVHAAAVGVVEPKRLIDLKPLLNDRIARAMLQPEYSGTGPPPLPEFDPPPGEFRQLRRECVDASGGRPLLMMRDTLPKMGKLFRLVAWSPGERSQSIIISTESSTLPDGSPLPQPIRGAPGCLAEVRHDSVTLLEPGRAEFDLILPPGSAGLRVFMQIATLAPGVNSAGLLTSHGYEMVIGQ